MEWLSSPNSGLALQTRYAANGVEASLGGMLRMELKPYGGPLGKGIKKPFGVVIVLILVLV